MRRRLPFALAVLALLTGMAPNGPGSGGSSGCTVGTSVQVPAASTPGQAVSVDTNAAVVCPSPQSQSPGSSWGPTQTVNTPPQPAGTACQSEVWEPLELSLTPGGAQQVFWVDPSQPSLGSITPEPQALTRIVGASAQTLWTQAGTTTDYFMPFLLNGKWDGAGNCIPKDPKDPAASLSQLCNTVPIALTCLGQRTNRVPGGQLPITALTGPGVDLRGQMLKLIHPGTISSLPTQPNPAVVNIPACFFINGADIGGRDVNAPQSFELVLTSNPDVDNRQVFYVFRIDVALQNGVTWNFGDSGATEGLPDPCVGVSKAPLQFAHRYVRYSPPGGFAVTAQETFTLHVTEYWVDANGIPNPPADLGNLPDIVVDAGPNPPIRETVIQEEGVPIGPTPGG